MAEKALIQSVYGLKQLGGGDYELQASAGVSNGLGNEPVYIGVVVSAPSMAPVPTWKSRIADAVKAEAALSYSLVVDEVVFPDFAVLNV